MRLQLAAVPVYEMPSACIIMPTNGRPEFVEHALGMIKRQDFSGTITEVVVVDDSPAALRVPFLSAGRQEYEGLVVDYVLPAEGAARGWRARAPRRGARARRPGRAWPRRRRRGRAGSRRTSTPYPTPTQGQQPTRGRSGG